MGEQPAAAAACQEQVYIELAVEGCDGPTIPKDAMGPQTACCRVRLYVIQLQRHMGEGGRPGLLVNDSQVALTLESRGHVETHKVEVSSLGSKGWGMEV